MWLIVFTAIPLVSLTLIEPAELAMLTLFTLAAFDAVIPLPDAFRLLGQVQQAATRLFAIVDRRPATTEPAVEAKPPASFDILLHQVSMQYRDEGPAVLKAVDLTIRQGSKLAIVGPTGAGKSSLIQLLLHYRDPSSGRISLGDRPISDYTQAQLHQWIAVVPQQIHLFNTTIRHNLLIAKPDASQQELEAACRHARIHDFIRQQPDGYDTWTGETGIKLSGGQARRIAIARALLRDFKLLVLDEPGESLDAGTEKAVINELVDIPGDRSLLMITHSHTGLDLMDEIKVLERGSLIDYRLYSAQYNAASTIFTC
jgi:ATP-binding cassette subfamily C protein CydC